MENPLTQTTMFSWFAERTPSSQAPKELPVRPGDEENQEMSVANAKIINDLCSRPLSEPRVKQSFICRWCLAPVNETPKSANEYIPLRAVLMLPDAIADPPICHDCYGNVLGSFNRQVTNVGTSNSGFANLALRNLA